MGQFQVVVEEERRERERERGTLGEGALGATIRKPSRPTGQASLSSDSLHMFNCIVGHKHGCY